MEAATWTLSSPRTRRQVLHFDSLAGCLCFVSVVLDVEFCSFRCVMGCVVRVPLRRVGVVTGCQVVTLFVMASGLTMMLCSVFVVLRRFMMVLRCLF